METTDPVSAAVILGTRPEIIKLAPLIREWSDRELPLTVLHTGQHYSDNLSSVFFKELELNPPHYNLEIGSGAHGGQTGEMIVKIEQILLEECPDVVFVQGDTNSVLASAVATSKLSPSLAHVEAGLRSFDRTMPEEINRRIADHASDYLFAPTQATQDQLLAEDLDDRVIAVTGNTVVDAVSNHIHLAETKSSILDDLGLIPGEFCLVTIHRESNVDNKSTFKNILQGIEYVGNDLNLELIHPIHPRAEDRVKEFSISLPSCVRAVEPLDYLDFLRLQSTAQLVLTDSGGVQEEACILRTPCITLRENTESPETIDVGANRLVGTDPTKIRRGAQKMANTKTTWQNPFGDGTAAEQIVDIVLDCEQ